eukprot:CAMPEP_0113563364 /NCGR_PEP_ID=MMETSP0015_2-20120614/21033_1 /TAXON_ID=2838 /ORGANISM="Odontella" /LENGTH=171 /DNA_ID=CAMNT_0000465347 /DNA_START=183 /DNA_END=698 /DNA_ORIENTATION=+ /assembly_acc=CAM_ASM_000160
MTRPARTVFVAVLAFASVEAFLPGPTGRTQFGAHSVSVVPYSSSALPLSSQPAEVDAGSLQVLGDDHESEGERLAKSVAGWLDNEWMEQEVHIRMGDAAKSTYVSCRLVGDDEIMSIMTAVSENLDSNWNEYDKDAFVNAWDIGNYVADYLMHRIGNEGCGCSAQIFDPDA